MRTKGFFPTLTSHTPEFNSNASRRGTLRTVRKHQNYVMDKPPVLNLQQVIPFHGYAKDPYVITHMRAGHRMSRREHRPARGPNRVWYTTHYTPVNQDTLRNCDFFENTLKMKIPYAGSKLQTQDINFDMTEYVIHWPKAASFPILLATGLVDNRWKIQETGFNLSKVKNDFFFHRVAANHNQLTSSPQYDAIKVRSDV